jgi:hypothetical protein
MTKKDKKKVKDKPPKCPNKLECKTYSEFEGKVEYVICDTCSKVLETK